MSMMTTLCAKAVWQLGNNIKAGKGPHIFSEQGPRRRNPALHSYNKYLKDDGVNNNNAGITAVNSN